MPPKRPASSQSPDTQHNGAAEIPNSVPNSVCDEFTRVVRKRLSTSTRTGQACDRCKVRKIRCDGLPGGCSPCIQNRSECKTTDRISQKAVPRGHLENLERRCEELEAKNKELQAALATFELESRTNIGYGHLQSQEQWAPNGATKPPPPRSAASFGERWRTAERAPYGMINVNDVPNGRLASFRPGNASTHYLGMSAGNSYLSSMKAQALSVLGIDIDLAVLDPNEPTNHTNPTKTDETYGSCLATIFNVNPNAQKAELPPKDEGLQWINYFFMISHPYLPIIHKPTFLTMVDRLYSDKTFEPTAAQVVSVHMVFAIVHWQNAASDRMKTHGQTSPAAKQLFERSRVHYHYAISLVYELLSGPSLEDLQAIGLILQHLRAFPKPGGSWLLSRVAMSMCLELGLHRSAKKWMYTSGSTPNYIDLEMRKRVFWCILALEVSLASKLGRPMSLRDGDYDAEYPEKVEDEYITASAIMKRPESNGDCSFDIAIEMFKHTNITIQIHSILYGAARPSRDKYVSLVEDLEGKLSKWRDGHPASLSLDSPKLERRFQAAHLHSWYHEARILMRHPSLSLSPSPSFTKDSLRICVESSRSILHLTDNLRKGNHYLDTTWYGATVQLLATLTILFSVWDKRESVTAEEIAQVKCDMDLCMDIMGDLGSLLGSPDRLREVVHVLTQGTMDLLNQKPEKGKSSPPLQSRITSTTSLPPFSNSTNSYITATSGPAIPTLKVPSGAQSANEIYQPPATYQQDVRTSSTIPVYGDPLMPAGDVVYDGIQAPANATTSALYNPTFSPTASAPAPHYHPTNDSSQQNNMFWGWSGDESWRRYMQNISSIAGELDPNETFSASALIALNQDCNNGIFNPNGNAPAPGGPTPPGLGIIGSSVGPAPTHGAIAPHNGFRPESGDPSWSVPMGYSFADSPVRMIGQTTPDTPDQKQS